MLILDGLALAAVDAARLDALVRSRECVISIASDEVRGSACAALLFSDYAVIAGDATLTIDSAAGWAGAVWRLGDRAMALLLSDTRFTAVEALEAGLVDEIGIADAAEWRGWRSEAALDSAAVLLDARGGDALERAEFARLFAAGEPQKGLRAFLEKRTPQFGRHG